MRNLTRMLQLSLGIVLILLTTSQAISSQIDRQNPYMPFFCNFDADDCGLMLTDNNYLMMERGNRLDAPNYTFTDFTSIGQPTADGEKCRIPFQLNGTEYFHCAPPNFECVTVTGTEDTPAKCADGSFLYGKMEKADSYYVASFPEQPIAKPGKYEFSFYAFMYCEGAECDQTNDIIAIYLQDGTESDDFQIEIPNDFQSYNSKGWKYFSFESRNLKTRVEVLLIITRLTGTSQATTYIGLDQLRLDYIGELETTTVDPSVDPNQVFYCNFDKAACGLKITGTSSTVFNIDPSIQVSGYKFTDMTSITEKALDGNECIIPFNVSNTVHYHCTSILNECQTSSGFSKCADGRFLWGKIDSTVNDQQISVELPQIATMNKGYYRLSFNAFLYGAESSCDDATDYIGADIKDYLGGGIDTIIIRYSDEPSRKPWNKYYIEFIPNLGATTIKLIAGRLSTNDCRFYFGFDNIELYYIKDPSPTTTPPTRTTTTKTSTQQVNMTTGSETTTTITPTPATTTTTTSSARPRLYAGELGLLLFINIMLFFYFSRTL